MARYPSFSRSKTNRDRRDQSYATWVIGEAERRRRAEPQVCSDCQNPAPNPLWAGNGKFAFCSDTCRDTYYRELEK